MRAIIVCDNDEAGEKTGERIKNELEKFGISCLKVTPPKDYKDSNDVLRSNPELLSELVEDWEQEAVRNEVMDKFRTQMGKTVYETIVVSMVNDYFPENRVNEAIGDEIIFVKSAHTTPSKRVRELCDELQDNLEPGEGPGERRVQNHYDRKFGCSGSYRSVENATAACLKMNQDEYMEFMKKQYDQMFMK